MRFMMLMIPGGYEAAEPGTMPPADRVAEMMKFNEELQKAGVLISLDGLHPPSMGARVSFAGGKPKVTDGPFAEAKEVLGGYWMIKVNSRQEAIDWASRCPASKNETIEIRQVQEFDDFPADVQEAAAGFKEMQDSPQPTIVSKMFVNLPVKNLEQSIAFFKSLGFAFNPQFTDENAGSLILGEHNYAMLLTEPYFEGFITKKMSDAKQTTGVLVALSLPNREAVDKMVNAAIAAGGKAHKEPADHGFMYQWGFEDLDGHVWEPFWMDPNFVQPAA